jgi:hypothetical protein
LEDKSGYTQGIDANDLCYLFAKFKKHEGLGAMERAKP